MGAPGPARTGGRRLAGRGEGAAAARGAVFLREGLSDLEGEQDRHGEYEKQFGGSGCGSKPNLGKWGSVQRG